LPKTINLQAKQDVVRSDTVEGLREKYAAHKRQSAGRSQLRAVRFVGNRSIRFQDLTTT
jgi:hypothetical protein